MENASKAIIMAGGILIGVLTLTIFLYVFTSFGGSSAEMQKQIDARVLAGFNNNFTKYENSNTCTIHDIISLVHFANKNNEDFPRESNYYINVYIDGKGELTDTNKYSNNSYIDLIKNGSVDGDKIQYYKCREIKYYTQEDESQRVKSITFRKV